MIVTRESSPAEIEALRQWCSKCDQVDPARWSILSHLATAQAVALPITEEAKGDLVLFTLGPRLTPHVRHREKYVDVPVASGRAFVFAPNGHHMTHRARTLRQFVAALERPADLEGYLLGRLLTRIGDVFGDFALAVVARSKTDTDRAGRRHGAQNHQRIRAIRPTAE
jgi:hypothetical protein